MTDTDPIVVIRTHHDYCLARETLDQLLGDMEVSAELLGRLGIPVPTDSPELRLEAGLRAAIADWQRRREEARDE